MMTRNILRKFTREDGIFLACFIAIFGGIILYNANKQAEGFITIAHDNFNRFVAGENILIKRVHEEHWDIFYRFNANCPDSRKTEENYRTLREKLEEGIRIWLAPLREITDRPIVDKFVFHKSKETNRLLTESGLQVEYEITATFSCKAGVSGADRRGRYIAMKEKQNGKKEPVFGNLPYSSLTLLHELGHAFDLADTYVGNIGFSPPNAGTYIRTIGNQPSSVMSAHYCRRQGGLCLDDKRAIQWLYRYHWEGLDPTDCPPEFVYEELTHTSDRYTNRTVGGCVYRQPLIIELRQKHTDRVKELLATAKNLKINDQDEHGLTALHYVASIAHELSMDSGKFNRLTGEILRYPGIDVNVTDNKGDSPLHAAVWFGIEGCYWVWPLLFLNKRDGVYPERKELKINAQNNDGMTALHYAAKLGRDKCTDYLLRRTDIDLNIKENLAGNTPLHEAVKNGRTEVVTMLLAHQDINPNLRNAAGFTPLQLALQGGAVSDADSDASFQADYPEFWASLSEENRQHMSSCLSPAALQQAHAEIAALLRAHPGIILPDASDVNGDGVVNILDLVKVSNAFGQRGQIPEDVNGDGVVNVQDLVWVAGAFGQ